MLYFEEVFQMVVLKTWSIKKQVVKSWKLGSWHLARHLRSIEIQWTLIPCLIPLDLSEYGISKYSLQCFILIGSLFMGLCKSNRNRRAHLKGSLSSYLNKVVEKKTLILESYIRLSFWNPSLHLLNLWVQKTKEIDLVVTLVRFWVLYQAKSLVPTIEDLIGVFMWSCYRSTTTIK